MTTLISTLRTRLHQRAAYNRTLAELIALPIDTRLDLDIAGIEDKVAHRAVYGH